MFRYIFVKALWLAVCVAMLLPAQTPYGSIVGRVLDSTAARVPGAQLTAINLATSVRTDATTNAEGNYELRALLPGRYRVEVQRQGFKRFERQPIEVRVGDVLTLEVILEVGALTESVTVTAEAPLLESSTASLGQGFDTRRISDLPRGAESVIYLLQLSVGVFNSTGTTALWPTTDRGNTGGMASSGARRGWALYAIDGNAINDSSSTQLNPNPEMIEEIQVQTNAVDASLGRFTGAYMNMMMKTGTNQFHGGVVGTFMDQRLMAIDYFTKQTINDPTTGPVTQAKIDRFHPKQHIDYFRPSAGGPVYLPGLYDGRNRTFWTYGLDRQGYNVNRQSFATVPTESERQGDFSQLRALGSQYQLYDPATIRPAAAGRFQRDPLPGNIIPASRISPMAKMLLKYWPLPNYQGTSDGRNNYSDPTPQPQPIWSMISRVDHEINQRNRFYASVTVMRQYSGLPSLDFFHTGATGSILDRRQRGLTLSDVMILRPDLVLDLRYSITRYSEKWPPQTRGFDLASLGLPASLVGQLDPRETTLPTITTGDVQAIPDGSRGRGLSYIPITYNTLAAQAAHRRGNHSLRLGTQIRVFQRNQYSTDANSPQYTFGTEWTRGPLDSSPAPTMGGGFAAFVLGLPSSGYIMRVPTFAETSKYLSVYFQDDWKVSRKLTVNLGLRYEVNTPVVERYNRAVRGYDFATANPIQEAARANYARNPIPEIPAGSFRTIGGLKFAGVQGTPTGMWDTDANNFSPRIGLAYLLRPTTVLRSAYAVFFQPMGADRQSVIQSGFERRTDLVPSLDNGQTFRATLQDPFPDGILEPLGATAGLRTYLGQSVSVIWPQLREPYLQCWSFNIQQAFAHQMLLDAGYVGSRAVGLNISEQLDPTPAQYLSTSPVRDQATINYLSQAMPNPFSGLPEFPGTALGTSTISRAQVLIPYPQFSGIGSTLNGGSSSYQSLQARFEKRFSAGWTVQAIYTWSKLLQAVSRLNATDPIPEHVISDDDRPHNFVVNGIYDLPLGRGHRWFSSRWQDKLFGGWSVQALYTAISGAPLSFGNIAFYGNIKDIPLPTSQRTTARWFNTDAGFQRDSTKQLASNIRTFPSRLSGARAFGANCMNASVVKVFTLRERLRFRVQADMVDAFNTPQWGAPNTSPTSSLFGQVSSVQEGLQRSVTIGARFMW